MSKENLERDRDNDDNDWLNPDAEHPCSTIKVPVSKPKVSCLKEAPNGLLCNTNIQVIKTQRVIAPQYSEEEVNARIKKAIDNLCQEFIKSTEETLKTIKKQKDIECNQIKIDMKNKSKNLFKFILNNISKMGYDSEKN
ncbi:hypothetical protein C2G38_2172323 [Gigaspora rosea]|uniref:Uncharacterized protein n=1 Tax=Gigaspora rosea TaxID=44941 RepID=A0A397VSV2_9GLOM|nr:hypothetical protein C2G38_2172323 [Gigaspora rosea]